MSDSNFDPMIRDVDESLKQDRLRELWNEYGSSLVTSAVALVIFTALFSGWNSYKARENRIATQNYITAIDADTDGKALDAALPNFQGGIKAVALLKQATLAREAGDEAKVTSSYKMLADETDAPEIYTDLGELLYTMTALPSAKDKAVIENIGERLNTLSQKKDSPWGPYAALVRAAYQAHQGGNTEEAAKILKEISSAESTPFSLQAEAKALAVFYARHTDKPTPSKD
ncbi:MAG: hypothetical protein AB7E85_03095 [Pseudobdellovibrionaceae bacterium]